MSLQEHNCHHASINLQNYKDHCHCHSSPKIQLSPSEPPKRTKIHNWKRHHTITDTAQLLETLISKPINCANLPYDKPKRVKIVNGIQPLLPPHQSWYNKTIKFGQTYFGSDEKMQKHFNSVDQFYPNSGARSNVNSDQVLWSQNFVVFWGKWRWCRQWKQQW